MIALKLVKFINPASKKLNRPRLSGLPGILTNNKSESITSIKEGIKNAMVSILVDDFIR
jgi:hypothetical protein